MKNNKRLLLLILAAVFCLALSGCVRFSDKTISSNAEDIQLIIEADEFALLDELSNLKSADFSGSECYTEILQWQETHPEVDVYYTVDLTDNLSLDNKTESLEILPGVFNDTNLAASAQMLNYLPALKQISFCFDNEEEIIKIISAFIEVNPELQFDYQFELCDKVLDLNSNELSLTDLKDEDAEHAAKLISLMPDLKLIHLGAQGNNPELSFTGIAALVSARPDLEYDYTFNFGDREFSLMSRELNVSHIKFDDEGASVRQIIPCMPRLDCVDMDSCGVSDEAMASIRDDFPDLKVVWRIWFGDNYSVRTDVEKILASKPGIGGCLFPEKVQSLKYCTEVKYMDLGHNPDMSDISFLEYMPKLEVLLICMDYWDDCSVLENCPNIEYLEIQTTKCSDISPLSNLKKLKHLNICYLRELDDISPLYGCTELERLWIGCLDPVPQEQIDKMQEICPNCEINTTTLDPTEEGWRYLEREKYGTDKLHPRYKELRDMFEYDKGDYAYSFVWNDPLSGTSWSDMVY